MAKLVLDIEPGLIEKIKHIAEKRNVTLTELTENLFRKEAEIVTEPLAELVINKDLPDWIKALTVSNIPENDFDAKKEYGDHIMRKYDL